MNKSMNSILRLTLFFLFSISSLFVLAQPVNDNCSGAIELFPTSYCQAITGTVDGATQSMLGCSGTADDDVWFKFTAQASVYKLQVIGSASFNPVIEYFSGNCSALTSVLCVDDNFGNGTSELFSLSSLTIGSEYFIRVYHSSMFAPSTKTFEICLSGLAVKPTCGVNSIPASDDCTGSAMLCDFNGYCGNTLIYNASTAPNGYNVNTWPELTSALAGISLNNNSFAKFVTISNTINFHLWVYNSSLDFGIQIAVLSIPTCGSGTVTRLYSKNILEPTGINDYHSISIGGLTPGQSYYIMIDGYAGDVCDYTIGLPPNSGFATATSVTPSVTDICTGASVDLFGSGGDGTYTWTSTDLADLNVNSGSFVVATPTTAGTKTYTVNSTNFNPLCPIINSADAIVNVFDTPTLSLVDTAICSGNFVDLVVVPSVLGGSYSWSSGEVIDSIRVTPIITTDYTITYTITGCPEAVETSTVSIVDVPVSDFTSDKLTLCENETAQLINNSLNTSSYEWIFSDGQTFTSENPSVIFSTAGQYSVTLIASNLGCKNTLTKNNYFQLNEQAVAMISASSNSVSSASPEVMFTNSSSNADSYIWDFGDETTSIASGNVTHSFPSENGVYYVKLVANNSNDCPDSIQISIRVKDDLVYYIPNSFTPNNSDIHNATFKPIFTSGYDPYSYQMLVFDRWGQVVFETYSASEGWDGTYKGKRLTTGTYLWRIVFGESTTDSNHLITGNVSLIK